MRIVIRHSRGDIVRQQGLEMGGWHPADTDKIPSKERLSPYRREWVQFLFDFRRFLEALIQLAASAASKEGI